MIDTHWLIARMSLLPTQPVCPVTKTAKWVCCCFVIFSVRSTSEQLYCNTHNQPSVVCVCVAVHISVGRCAVVLSLEESDPSRHQTRKFTAWPVRWSEDSRLWLVCSCSVFQVSLLYTEWLCVQFVESVQTAGKNVPDKKENMVIGSRWKCWTSWIERDGSF